MEETYKRLQDATVQIFLGEGRKRGSGSGFHFKDEETIVTNAHVVKPLLTEEQDSPPVYAVTSEGSESELELITAGYKKATGEDYAIFDAQEGFDDDRTVLEPTLEDPSLGTEVLFAGFPHGVSHNLVSRAYVSGNFAAGFYLDGAINSGNSGGPAIDMNTGEVYGIVTAKRYISPGHLEQLEAGWEELRNHETDTRLNVGGIDITNTSRLMAESMRVLNDMLEANASTGIGRVQPIDWVLGDLLDESLG